MRVFVCMSVCMCGYVGTNVGLCVNYVGCWLGVCVGGGCVCVCQLVCCVCLVERQCHVCGTCVAGCVCMY